MQVSSAVARSLVPLMRLRRHPLEETRSVFSDACLLHPLLAKAEKEIYRVHVAEALPVHH